MSFPFFLIVLKYGTETVPGTSRSGPSGLFTVPREYGESLGRSRNHPSDVSTETLYLETGKKDTPVVTKVIPVANKSLVT